MTKQVALLACAPTFWNSSAWWRLLLIHPWRQDCSLSLKLSNHSENMLPTYCSVTQSHPLPPPKYILFHFLSSICRTYFAFLLLSTAASLISTFYSCILNTFSKKLLIECMLLFTIIINQHWGMSSLMWICSRQRQLR